LVYGCEDLFERLPIHWMWWPAIGAVFIGIGGVIDPRVLGVGYDTIHSLMRGEFVGAAIIGLLIAKALVWSVALGSGTSGGVLAPLLIIGGALGALEGRFIPFGDPGMWAMISMAAMMGGTMRSPLTSMIFTLELTRDLNLLPALLVSCIAAHALTVLWLRRSILTEKVARRGFHVTRDFFAFRCDNQIVAWQAVLAGLGIGVVTQRVALQSPQVVRVLSKVPIAPLPLWITAHRELRGTPRLKLVFDALADALGAH